MWCASVYNFDRSTMCNAFEMKQTSRSRSHILSAYICSASFWVKQNFKTEIYSRSSSLRMSNVSFLLMSHLKTKSFEIIGKMILSVTCGRSRKCIPAGTQPAHSGRNLSCSDRSCPRHSSGGWWRTRWCLQEDASNKSGRDFQLDTEALVLNVKIREV